jgi:hypothetical protein
MLAAARADPRDRQELLPETREAILWLGGSDPYQATELHLRAPQSLHESRGGSVADVGASQGRSKQRPPWNDGTVGSSTTVALGC